MTNVFLFVSLFGLVWLQLNFKSNVRNDKLRPISRNNNNNNNNTNNNNNNNMGRMRTGPQAGQRTDAKSDKNW